MGKGWIGGMLQECLSMHTYRGIVRTRRWSDGLSTRPDDQNTITCQSDNTNEAPRGPLLGPVTWNPARTWPYSTLQLHLRLWLCLQPCTSPPPSQSPQSWHHCVNRPPTFASDIQRQPRNWQQFFWSQFFDLIQLTIFGLIRLNWGFV